ncbi:response regulator [Sabulicella rubraurantiaca]|uniref:response regulator n=1 Tax=Sabulicella rubraurantiaca TaxID=2811429 RepID=UPI001A95A46F|nr:response regulator [Sabulicella rubraurantiaca]
MHDADRGPDGAAPTELSRAALGEPSWTGPRSTAFLSIIAASTIALFALDLVTPLGVANWLFYLLPILLSFLLWHPAAPLALAAVTTALMLAGYWLSPPGVDPMIGAVNRGMGVVTVWVLSIGGSLFVSGRLAVRRQEWLQSGQLQLSARMSGEQGLDQISGAVLDGLCRHAGATVGAFYVAEGGALVRRATYAVPDPGALPERIQPGDGLLGEAARDRRIRLLHRLPAGYLRFGSALGATEPHSLLLAPIELDGELKGAVELGFADAAGQTHAELLRRTSNAIAVALRSAQYRARLQDLLDETQRQAEELQRQGEELRSSNEELEEQSRELEASQAALESQQKELRLANERLEERTRTLERSESALKDKARELEQASRYKSEFLANMSHELRTPLNSSLIMARLLADNRDGNLSEEQVRFAETIESAGNDLLTLINDILDLSKIEAGRVELRPSVLAISDLTERLRRTFEPVARERGLSFRVEAQASELETDGQRLEQILKNFLSNALKFTEAGEVVLEVDTLPDGRVAFSVRDTGIGIEQEQQEAVFEAFRQADGTTARRYGGTGLGLSISRELARLLGGTIELASAPGRGSTFTLVLPPVYAPVTALDAPAPAAAPPSGIRIRDLPPAPPPVPAKAAPHAVADDRDALEGARRILLVIEDDAAFAGLLRDLAREQGFHCLVAGTADEGVAMARAFLPHAIVLDLGLPDHSGISVLDRLKHDLTTRHIPVHIASAQENWRAALALGAVGFLQKPVSRDQLSHALRRLEGRIDHKLRRVLIVEDDPVQLDAIRRLLASDEVETVGAATGTACLEELSRQTFDCMVLDVSLPDMTGFELLDRLSADETRPFPPVIVYTGRDLLPEDELRLRRYSSSIIVKGARSPERLLDEVSLFLHQVVSEMPGEQQQTLVRALNRDAVLEGRRILIVEDDVRNIFALTSVLEPHGATVIVARNGREALAALDRAEAAGEPMDLVLMDVMMPEMDGITATRHLREKPERRSLPVIMLTAKAMPDDQRQCLEAGANDYMAKPLDVEKLLSLVRVWMPR